MKTDFTRKIAKEIAHKSFDHVLDCILGYSDSGYELKSDVEIFEQNFEEDLQEKKIVVTERRIKICKEEYEKLQAKFEQFVRKKYKY